MHQEGVKAMSKDELQFISDLTEKHQISLHTLLRIMGAGTMAQAHEFCLKGDTDGERQMVNLEADIARAVGIIPVIELLEGSEDFE